MLNYNNPKLILDSSRLKEGSIKWKSPSNLAIVKYWGKHAVQLPNNPSISMTLNNAVTETSVEYGPKQRNDKNIDIRFFFDGEEKPAFASRIEKYLESLLPIFPFLAQLSLKIHSKNSFPHSAGIASSASSMSALALCICSIEDRFFGTLVEDDAFDKKASYVSRLGSGSACRSIFPKWSIWGKTIDLEGTSDEYAIPFGQEVHPVFSDMHDDVLIVSSQEKSVSSSAGHALMENNPYSDARYRQANTRLSRLLSVMRSGDLEEFGTIAENEALSLHALMMTSSPSYLLMNPNSLAIIEKVRAYRQETKNPVYFSLDAGPNIHLLYPSSIVHELRPFIEEELLPFCVDGMWINDWAGEGPEQL